MATINGRRGLPPAQPPREQASNSRFREKAGQLANQSLPIFRHRNQFRRSELDQRFSPGRRSRGRICRSGPMTILKWALIFFLVSIVAGILGFTGISAASADVARFLFYVFVVIFLVLLILGLTIFRV
jgi:uncharacterized membrane protein YtjA (UPF0391 family)